MVNILNELAKYLVVKKVNKDVLDKLDRGETVEAYLYCTKGKPYLYYNFGNKEYVLCDDKDNVTYYDSDYQKVMGSNLINGTIPVKVVIDGYIKMSRNNFDYTYGNMQLGNMTTFLKNCQLSHQQFMDYGNGKDLYALHISKVEILDEVMKLGDMYNFKNDVSCEYWLLHEQHFKDCNLYPKLKRPPQNMMSVWVK
jgi:hypothetical protein